MMLNGILLATKNLDRAVQFYQELFDLEIIADFGANKTLTGGISLQTLETWTSFISKPEEEIRFQNNATELYFETEDLDAFAKKLEGFPDITFVHPPMEQTWGQRTIRLYDPDFHMVEVSEDMKVVTKRFADQGLTIEEIAAKMDVQKEYVIAMLPG